MKSFLYLAIISIVTIPTTVFAQNYLVGIPGVDQGAGNFDAYIQAVYVMFISIAALLAVVKIIIAGLKYMFTDIVPQKTDAKKDIQGAVFGLLIVMSAVLILTVINPELTGFTFDQSSIGAPEPGDQDTEFTIDDATTLQNYCALEVDLNCTATPCDTLATDYFITWLVNDPINRITCSSLCTGVVIQRDFWNTGQCLHPTSQPAFGLDSLAGINKFDCQIDADGESICEPAISICESNGRTAEIVSDESGPYVRCFNYSDDLDNFREDPSCSEFGTC
jgi:hypothetical protein